MARLAGLLALATGDVLLGHAAEQAVDCDLAGESGECASETGSNTLLAMSPSPVRLLGDKVARGLSNDACVEGDVVQTRERLEVRSQSQEAWSLLKAAWRSAEKAGLYAYFPENHNNHYGKGKDDHGPPTGTSFLPYHRSLSLDLENVIRQQALEDPAVDGSDGDKCLITLPYWDWTLGSMGEVLNAVYLGEADSNTGCIISGLPKDWTTPVEWIGRGWKGARQSCVERRTRMNRPKYDEEDMYEIEDEAGDFLMLAEDLEVHHNNLHGVLGGNMMNKVGFHSPSDPAFFFHHNFIDYLWYRWQKKNSDSDSDAAATLSKARSNDRSELAPWVTSYDAGLDCVLVPGSTTKPDTFNACLRYLAPAPPAKTVSPKEHPCKSLGNQIRSGKCTLEEIESIPCIDTPSCKGGDKYLCQDNDSEEDCEQAEQDVLKRLKSKRGSLCKSFVPPTDNIHCHSCDFECAR